MKILVLLPRFPYPLDKGDKLRAYHQIVELSKQHEIYLFALSHRKVDKSDVDKFIGACNNPTTYQLINLSTYRLRWWESAWGVFKAFLSGQPLQLGYWSSRRARRAYTHWERQTQPDVIYCQMVRTMPTVAGSPYRKVLDFQDALSLNTRRRMERSHGPMKWVLRYEYKALQRTEQEALRLFDAITVISPADRDTISQAITLVPNGVDTDYFNQAIKQPSNRAALSTAETNQISEKPSTIVFTGNMSYAPNVDAARWLVKEIMPLVWSQIPSATVLLAGADPKPAVKALAGPNVTVTGRLDDIRTAYASAKMFVAPMRIGSGMQNKLLEAMSMGLPCVTTSIAATPLGATTGEHLLVGDTAEEIADLIVKLTIEEIHHNIADGGHRFVLEHYSWPAAVAPLNSIFNS